MCLSQFKMMRLEALLKLVCVHRDVVVLFACCVVVFAFTSGMLVHGWCGMVFANYCDIQLQSHGHDFSTSKVCSQNSWALLHKFN